MSVSFNSTLGRDDWDDHIGGWRCPALGLPGAKLEALYTGGGQLATDQYGALPTNHVKWRGRAEPPEEVEANVILTKGLVTDRWKRASILLGFVGTVLGTPLGARFADRIPGGRSPAAPPDGTSLWTVNGGIETSDGKPLPASIFIVMKPPDQQISPTKGRFTVAQVPINGKQLVAGVGLPPTLLFVADHYDLIDQPLECGSQIECNEELHKVELKSPIKLHRTPESPAMAKAYSPNTTVQPITEGPPGSNSN